MLALDATPEVVVGGDLPAALRARMPERVRPAAVAVPLIQRASGTTVLFTRRTDHLHEHAGQVSFPGGRMDRSDEGAVATALRESHEEVGLAPERVEVIGFLDLYLTITGYAVTPVVCSVDGDYEPRPEPFEVADVFEVPLSFLMDAQNHIQERRRFEGSEVSYWRIPWEGFEIWGATAGMLRDLYSRLREDDDG